MKKYRMYGLDDETRLAIEEASKGTITTESARILVEASVNASKDIVEKALEAATKEVSGIIGPHGAVTRLQAGGVNISRGGGVQVFADGVQVTTIEPDGDLLCGSDVTQPATTTFICFANAQRYNNEDMGAGDLLIGDNTEGTSNTKYDASEGQLQFRYGQTVNVYVDTDGTLKAGAGAVTLDADGISLIAEAGYADKNTIKFVDSSGNILSFITKTTTGALTFEDYGLPAGVSTSVAILSRAASGKVGAITIQATSEDYVVTGPQIVLQQTNTGVSTIATNYGSVTFNDYGLDYDTVIEGNTDANLLFVDASTDRVGIGMNNPAHKLDVTGDVNVSGGYYVDGVLRSHADISFEAYQSTPHAMVTATSTVIVCDSEVTDTDGYYNPATGRFTPLVAGTYEFHAAITINALADGKEWWLGFRKNGGSIFWEAAQPVGAASSPTVNGTRRFYMDGVDDYVEVIGYHTHGSNRNTLATDQGYGCRFGGHRLCTTDIVGA